jgi:hypothetical protein
VAEMHRSVQTSFSVLSTQFFDLEYNFQIIMTVAWHMYHL